MNGIQRVLRNVLKNPQHQSDGGVVSVGSGKYFFQRYFEIVSNGKAKAFASVM